MDPMSLAVSWAHMRYGKAFTQLTPAQPQQLMVEATRRVGYQGALYSGGDVPPDDLEPDDDAIADVRKRGRR